MQEGQLYTFAFNTAAALAKMQDNKSQEYFI